MPNNHAPAAKLNEIAAGFGSAWLDDTARGLLLRMDPRTRRVIARIPVQGNANIAAGAGAMWAIESSKPAYELTGPLLRIDPRTNRVTARIALRTTAGRPFVAWEVIARDDLVWLIGPDGLLRVDPSANRIIKAMALGAGGEVSDATLLGPDLWILMADGRLIRFDARSGARMATVHAALVGDLVAARDALIVLGDNEVARVDLATGRALWRARVRPVTGAGAAVADERVWVPTGDRLVGLDPLDGHAVASVDLGEFGATGVRRVGSELWLATAGGHLVILR